MTTITANIPAKTITFSSGETRLIEARTETFTLNNRGMWVSDDPLYGTMFDEDVIDICKKATNWHEIRNRHFRMEGFHS